MADTSRQEKVNKLLQRELGEIFQREAQAKLKNMLISVTVVRITPDLGLAKVYLSVFPSNKSAELVREIDEMKGYFRNLLGQRIKNQMKSVPELHFYLDDSLDYIDNIDNILNDK